MGQISLSLPQVGGTNASQEPLIPGDFSTIQTVINGNLDATNISAGLAQSATVNQAGQPVKGVTVNAGAGTRTNAAYGALNDAVDQVTGIVLPSNGLIAVWYQALWSASGATGPRAAIFVGSNQLKGQVTTAATGNAVSTLAAVGLSNSVPLVSGGSYGIVSTANNGATAADVTTGQTVGIAGDSSLVGQVELGGVLESSVFPTWGAPTYIFAAAGTYTISVQFKAATGTVTASARRLWVQAFSFA